MLCCAVW